MSFDTERPKTASQRIQSIIESQNRRKYNLRAIAENARIEHTTAQTQSVLESIHAQQLHEDSVTESLARIKQQRARQQFAKNTTVGQLALLENAKKTVMNKVLFEMVYDAYWLDNDVKGATVQESYNKYREIMSMVEETCSLSKVPNHNKTKFIHAVEETVSEICTKAVNRIITEAKETGETDIKFDLTTEEEAELDTKLSDLGRDDIVELVKDKVLTVVQDERECGKEKASILQELHDTDENVPNDNDDDLADDDSEVEEGAAYTRTMCYDTYVPVSEGVFAKFKHNKKLKKEASSLLAAIGTSIGFKDEGKIFVNGIRALNKNQYDEATKKFNEYIKIMTELKKKIGSVKGDYSDQTIKSLQNACDMEISLTNQFIEAAKIRRGNLIDSIKIGIQTKKEVSSLLAAVGSSISFKEENKILSDGIRALNKNQYDEATKKFNEYIKIMTELKKKIGSVKGDYNARIINTLKNSCDMEIIVAKNFVNQANSLKKQAISESYTPVEESAVELVLAAAVLGVVISALVISSKEKVELKKALKLYELKCNPMIKMSELTPTLYEIDSAHRVTDKELTGLKKLFKEGAQRAKVWRDPKGNIVCTAILYTTTSISPGITASSDGVSPTLNIQSDAHYMYDVSDKYKKDALYLSAYMAFCDKFSTDNSRALTNDMKKAFGDEFKSIKVKPFGKTLESAQIMENISPSFVEYESACELMEECGVSDFGAEATCVAAMNETDPKRAIQLFEEYKDILQQGKTSVLVAPTDKYSHKVKTVVTNAIDAQQQMCDTNIDKITAKMNTVQQQTPENILLSMRRQNIQRTMNKAGASTLFESMMVANTKKSMESAVTEGLDISREDSINAALIESILQYTVLETLNTTKLYNFTDTDVKKLKARNKLSIR